MLNGRRALSRVNEALLFGKAYITEDGSLSLEWIAVSLFTANVRFLSLPYTEIEE
jgi:hypothetical protein